MKQKNMILVAVAIGFGLLAALLATQMNAKPQEVVIQEIDVPVAAKELPLNTKLSKDEIKTYVEFKKFRKDAMPPGDWVVNIDDLADKRCTRTIHQGELFGRKDVSNKPTVEIPPGKDMMTFGVNREKIVGGFAAPGAKVDVVATMRLSKKNKSITFPLFQDMLILAVDIDTRPTETGVKQAASDVSVAVTKDEAMMLHAAIGRGADLRLLLIGQEATKDGKPVENKYGKPPTRDEIWQILTDEYGDELVQPSAKEGDEKFETVEVPAPKEDIPAGTRLTKELIETKFGMTKIVPPAPGNVIKNIVEHEGKYLLRDLSAHQFVPRTFVADEMPKPAEEPKFGKGRPTDDDAAAPKAAPVEEPKEELVETPKGPPPVYHDVTVQTASGARKYRYQKLPNGGWKFHGEQKGAAADEDDAAPADAAPPRRAADPKATGPDAKKQPANPRVIRG